MALPNFGSAIHDSESDSDGYRPNACTTSSHLVPAELVTTSSSAHPLIHVEFGHGGFRQHTPAVELHTTAQPMGMCSAPVVVVPVVV
jgi:hypothetical protein